MTRDLGALSPDFQHRLKAELQRGERLIYAGRPGIHISWGKAAASLFYIAFTVFWCTIGFTFGAVGLAGILGFAPPEIKGGGPFINWFFFLFSIPFMLIGIGLLVTPIYRFWKSRRTVHVVTNDRILSVFAKPFTGIESHVLSTITYIHRKDYAAGSGALRIGHGSYRDSEGDPRPLELTWTAIPDVKRAEAAIRDAMRKSPGTLGACR
jgi:hypothetical protein